MKLNLIFSTLKRSWISQFWMNLSTFAVLSLSLGLIYGTVLFSHNTSRLFSVWGEEIQITVYLTDNISESQIEQIKKKLESSEYIVRHDFIDKVQAAKLFEKSLKNYGPQFLSSLKSEVGSPFPASYQIQLKPEFNSPEKVSKIADEFSAMGGIEDVSYGQEWVGNYTNLMRIARVLGILFGIAIFVGCLFTVSNSIRASLASRREEVEILELIGATNNEIRAPFLIEGAFQGIISSVFAILILGGIYSYSFQFIDGVLGAQSADKVLTFFSPLVIFLMVLFGGIIGAAGSYICVSKINTGWAAAEGARSL
ncbi:MAG: ABC transporter permease [Oligoflexia bacterium]|nr:ABC transporter permease [Oligoflexia bacterium]